MVINQLQVLPCAARSYRPGFITIGIFLRFFTVKETRSSALNAPPINRQQGRGFDFFAVFGVKQTRNS